jgi:hypothetical protein
MLERYRLTVSLLDFLFFSVSKLPGLLHISTFQQKPSSINKAGWMPDQGRHDEKILPPRCLRQGGFFEEAR